MDKLKYLDAASRRFSVGGEEEKLKAHLKYLRALYTHRGDRSTKISNDPFPSSCPSCFVEFKGSQYSLRIVPSSKPSRNMMKMLHMETHAQSLTTAQKALLLQYREQCGRRLIIKCAVCLAETTAVIKKQMSDTIKQRHAVTSDTNISLKNNPTSLSRQVAFAHSKRKKKKKDKFAGLNMSAVMSSKSKKKKEQQKIAKTSNFFNI